MVSLFITNNYSLLGYTEIFILLVIVFILNRIHFIAAFLPFLILLYVYDMLRAGADNTSISIHITDLLNLEQNLFGSPIPTVRMQQFIARFTYIKFVAVHFSNFFYGSEFWITAIFAVVLWYKRKRDYVIFMTLFVSMSFVAYIFYYWFPAAPPWWVAYYGYFPNPQVQPDLSLIPINIMLHVSNPVAALPSLHAAHSAFIAVYCVFVWRRKMQWMLLYPVCVSIAAIYLGHHYIVDIILGVAYAAFFCLFAYIIRNKMLIR